MLTRCLMLASLAALDGVEPDETLVIPKRTEAPPLATARPLAPEHDVLARAAPGLEGRLYVDGAALTLDPKLQRALQDFLAAGRTPWGAVVVLEVSSGRVLAMAERSQVAPSVRGLCTRALFPAASLFKVVTAAALLDAGVSPQETACFHGGLRQVSEDLLGDSAADARCVPFEKALGLSANVAFAKFTARYLDADHLARVAKALKFNTPFPFAVPTDVSLAAIPLETHALASTGAGFGDVYLSPLHAAALAAAVASRGVWRWPVLFERDVEVQPPERIVDAAVAEQLDAMLAVTVSEGTARRAFAPAAYHLDAAGKTGSLADKKPVFRDYSWFLGYAPRSAPLIAVAAVVVNEPLWHIRGTTLAAEALRLALAGHPRDNFVKTTVNR